MSFHLRPTSLRPTSLRPTPLLIPLLALLVALGFSARASGADPSGGPLVSEALHYPLPARDPADQGTAAGRGAAPEITPQDVDNRSFQGFHKLLASGEYFMQPFTVTTKAAFNFQAAFSGNTDVAIITATGVAKFTQGQAFPSVAKFGNKSGTQFVTLKPADYFLAARTFAGSAEVSVKLDFQVQLKGYETTVKSELLLDPVEPHHYLSQKFVVTSNVQFFIDGCNSRLPFFIMTEGDYANYQAGGAFDYIPQYSGDDPSLPGPWELGLSPGAYYLVFENGTDEPQPVAYYLQGLQSIVPAPPTDLSVTAFPAQNVYLVHWTDHAVSETKYFVELKKEGKKYKAFPALPADTTEYLIQKSSLPLGTVYYFRVRARNSRGYSAYSDEVSLDLRS